MIGKYVAKTAWHQEKTKKRKKNPELRWSFLKNSGFRTGGYTLCHKIISTTQLKKHLGILRKGKIVLVTDDPDRENEGDLICAAEFATRENINFMATYAKGLICTPMSAEIAARLNFSADGC